MFPGQMRTLPDVYYNRYRDYDPTIGRYIQADPIGLAGGSNPYLYANGNPLRYTDPTGKCPICLAILIGAGGGAIWGGGFEFVRQYFWEGSSWKDICWQDVRREAEVGALIGGVSGGTLEWAAPWINRVGSSLASKLPKIRWGTNAANKAASRSLTVEEVGADLTQQAGKNRVSAMTPSGRTQIDLAGKGHFEKSLGQDIPTPHVKFQELNVGPNGRSSLSPGTIRPATMQDIRTARKIIERRK